MQLAGSLSHPGPTLCRMTTIEVPEEVAAALTAAAAERRLTVAEFIAELVSTVQDNALDSFIGVGASGLTEPVDVPAERAALADRQHTATI